MQDPDYNKPRPVPAPSLMPDPLPQLYYRVTLRFGGTSQTEVFHDPIDAVRWAERARTLRQGLYYTMVAS